MLTIEEHFTRRKKQYPLVLNLILNPSSWSKSIRFHPRKTKRVLQKIPQALKQNDHTQNQQDMVIKVSHLWTEHESLSEILRSCRSARLSFLCFLKSIKNCKKNPNKKRNSCLAVTLPSLRGQTPTPMTFGSFAAVLMVRISREHN